MPAPQFDMVTRRQCCHSARNPFATTSHDRSYLFKVLREFLICLCDPVHLHLTCMAKKILKEKKKENLILGIAVHVLPVRWSDTAISSWTHGGLITPQVTGPPWHPPAATGFYEDWKLTRQVLAFKSVRISVRKRTAVSIKFLPPVRRGRNVDFELPTVQS